ncbi:MAG: YdhR family protein [Deltaproteobacteria bacterium]|nr:YdhR family protein [Deltaproteobacteria bacterium]
MGKSSQLLLFVRFKSSLSTEELTRRCKERLPSFRALDGLLQKYYVHDPQSGEWGGVYIWESQAALEAYRGSELCHSIADAYQVIGAPRIEVCMIAEYLRPTEQ